jgi:hypothetical protein
LLVARLRTGLREGSSDPRPADDGRPGRRELALAGAGLAVLTLAIYLPYAVHGGLFTDDYAFISEAKQNGFHPGNMIRARIDSGYRPLGLMTQQVQANLFGDHRPGILLPAILNTFLGGFALYLACRLARLRSIWAGAIAVLFVTLPWIDATRLWAAANLHGIATELWLFGLAAALWGLRSDDPRRRVARHGLALLFYGAAVLTSEGFWAPVCASGAVYLTLAPPRAVLRRSAADIVVTALCLAPQLHDARRRGGDTSLSGMYDRAGDMLDAWVQLIRFTVPADHVLWGPLGLAIALAAAVGLGMSSERRDRLSRAVPGWGALCAAGLVLALAGLATYLPTPPVYTPHLEGTDNRFAAQTAVGTVVLLIGLLGLLSLGLASLARRPRAAFPLAVAMAALVVLGAIRLEHREQGNWNAGRDRQEAVLGAIASSMGGRPPHGSSIVTVRHENFTNHGVPVFTTSWDLYGAVDYRWNDSTLKAHPFQLPMTCAPRTLDFPDEGGPSRRAAALPYRALTMVDVPTRTAIRIRSRRACLDVVGDLGAGRAPRLGG